MNEPTTEEYYEDQLAQAVARIKELQSQLIEIEASRDQLADDMQWVLTSLTLAVDAFGPLVDAYATAKNAHHRGANPCEYLEPVDFERALLVHKVLTAKQRSLKDKGYKWEHGWDWEHASKTLDTAQLLDLAYGGGPPFDGEESET